MKKILVPVAFTPNSEAMLRYATELATHFQADITLLHAVGEHDMVHVVKSGAADVTLEDLEIAAFRKITELKGQFPLPAPLNVDIRVVVGFPGEIIPQTALSIGADLLVLPHPHDQEGTHPLSPIVAKALHDAPCPVLLVPTDLIFQPPKHIFFAFEMDQQLPAELDTMREWLREFGADLQGVHILKNTESRPIAALELQAAMKMSQVQADFTLSEGPWREQIEDLSILEGADLLAIAPPHRSGLSGWLNFRALRRLVNEEPLPVLIFGARGIS